MAEASGRRFVNGIKTETSSDADADPSKSGRSNSRSRNPGRNRKSSGDPRDSVIAKELEKKLAQFKLIPVPARVKTEIAEPRLEDISLSVDMTEISKLPPGSRDLRITLGKCCKVKRYDIISLELLTQLLKKTESEIPHLKKRTKGTQDVICVSSKYAPHLLHLQWQKQKDRYFMITHCLTDRIRYKKILKLDCKNAETMKGGIVGKIVAAPRLDDDVCARAIIQGFVNGSDNRVRVYYIDYGDEHNFDLDRLYECPKEIADAPPLCFPARLAGLDFYEIEDKNSVEVAQDAYIFNHCVLNFYEYSVLKCEVVGGIGHPLGIKEQVYEVRLWKGEMDVGKEVSRLIMKRNNERTKFDLSCRPNPNEICQLLYLDEEVNVPEYIDNFRSLKECRVSTIISPGEFYLTIVGIERPWYDKMQKFYKDPANRRSLLIKTPRLFKSRCYAWNDSACKTWNRVRVVNPAVGSSKDKHILVWALDRGNYAEVRIENMIELSPEFAKERAMSFKAHLAHIKPRQANAVISSKGTEASSSASSSCSVSWQAEASDFFRSCCAHGDKVFYCISLGDNNANVKDHLSSSSHSVSLEVILAEVHRNVGTVQADLVNSGFAVPTGISSGRHDLIFSQLSTATGTLQVPIYDRREIKQKLKINFENLVPFNCAPKKNIDSSRKQEVQWATLRKEGQRLPFAFAGHPELFMVPSAYDNIPSQMQQKMAYIAISSSRNGPENFCIQMEYKMAELKSMTHDLALVAQVLPVLSRDDMYPGMFAIAIPAEGEKADLYGRVVIVSIGKNSGVVIAVFIDYGFEVAVESSSVRELPGTFAAIPPFCCRAHLDFTSSDNLVMPAGDVGFTPAAEIAWHKHVISLEDWKPVYYAWQVRPGDSNGGNVIPLEEFNQTVNFDRKTLKWHAGPRQRSPSIYSTLNLAKDHPLLRHLFLSVGVTIEVEMKGESDEPYMFKPIWKTLMEENHIVPIGEDS